MRLALPVSVLPRGMLRGLSPAWQWRRFAEFVLFGAIVLATSWAGVTLTEVTGRVAIIWITNAVVASYLLKSPRRDFAALLVIATAADMAGGTWAGVVRDGIPLSMCNTLEDGILVLALWRLGGQTDFALPRTLGVFYALAAGPATVLSALVAALVLYFSRGAQFSHVFWNWYLGDALGLVILVPPLVTAKAADFTAMFARRQFAGTLLALSGTLLVIALKTVFPDDPIAFLFFPAVLLLTFARGFAGGTLGILIADGYLLIPALTGHGRAFSSHNLHDQVMIILIFAAVLSFTVVLTGAALDHRRRLERGLAEALAHAEEAREEAIVAKDAAENANRSKSMFLANMSHELRTPLNAVIGFSEVMSREMFGPLGQGRYRDYAGLIHNAGAHLLDLINDILDMSKIEAGKFEIEKASLDGCSVVDDCLRLMQERAAASHIRLVRDLPAGPLPLFADRRALKQILLNLLSNAVKFTPEHGRVTVQLAADPARQICVLRVADTGVGIPAEAISRLGNPFVQVRGGVATTHQGTGLGLALVRALIRMHDGSLRIESVVGAGTTVTVELPLGAGLTMTAMDRPPSPRAALPGPENRKSVQGL